MEDTTILYYTSNQEDETFERKVRDNILENSGGLPIVSVSQKPIDFGKNICVGEQPYCEASALRQQLIGLQAIDTKFAIAAESDCLYPPEYFRFTPPTEDNVYRYTNVWVFTRWVGPRNKGLFWKKRFSEGAQTCGRDYWIERLEYALQGVNGWEDVNDVWKLVFHTKDQYQWSGESPVINVKDKSMRKYTTTSDQTADTLPFWGTTSQLRNKFNLIS